MPVTSAEIAALADTRDIIAIGARADDVRRERHGMRTTFVRVAVVPSDADAAADWPPAAGEIRIGGAPSSVAGAVRRVRAIAGRANGVPVSAYSLSDLEQLAAAEGVPLRAL